MEPLKILLVDDETDFAVTLAERLRLRGLAVETAFDGEQALEKIEQDLPQIVVLDVMMPGLGGMEVLQRVREDHPHLPVILLTGHGSTRDGIEGMKMGAFDYLMKPIKIEELVEKIEEALGGAR
jgi:two-component system, OmpR family, response regulator